MKLDRIKFATLVQFIASSGRQMDTAEISELDCLTEINVEPVATQYVEVARLDELLASLNAEGKFIEAIKAYRSLTGAGLKESKEAVERYRNVKTVA